MSATVIIPATGTADLTLAVQSVLTQDYKDIVCQVVVDGEKFLDETEKKLKSFKNNEKLKFAFLQNNVGANGFYGHRIYAAFTHLINTEFVLYLDQDNYFDSNHVDSCISTIKEKNLDWSYSLRKIINKDGHVVCNDDCESLGKWPVFTGGNHIDTNSYCVKTSIAIRIAQAWHGGWGQDRVWFSALNQHFTNYDCTGLYTVNYKIGGNEGSVKEEFFKNGNKIMNEKYNGEFPWRKKT